MALVTVNDEEQRRELVVYKPGQRQLALRRARRHSVFVRVLRVLLPIAAIALLACYALFLSITTKLEDGAGTRTIKFRPIEVLSTRPTMYNPTYEGSNDNDGSTFLVKAQRAVTDLDQSKPVDLFGITGRLQQVNGTVTDLSADEGKYSEKQQTLLLKDNIIVRSTDGMAARLSTATVQMKQNLIISDTPVAVGFPAGTLHSDTMRLHHNTRNVYFAGNVVANLKSRQTPASGNQQTARNKPQPRSLASFPGQSDQPVIVRAPKLHIDDNNNTALFSNGVTAIQGDAQIESQTLNISYARDGAGEGAAGASGSVRKVYASDDVRITRGGDVITSAKAAFDIENGITNLNGNVVIQSQPDRKIVGERAVIKSSNETAVLTGRVTITQAGNTLRGSRLDMDQRRGLFVLTNPVVANGKISATLANSDRADAGAAQPSSQRPVNANSVFPTQMLAGGSGGSIAITARRLDVDDQRRLAIFSGEVHAKQGEYTIKTEQLRIAYSGSAGLGLGQAPSNAEASAQSAAKVRSITAPQRVIVESATGQYAAGDNGKFHYDRSQIELFGNVLIKRGRQIIRGESLWIDTAKGVSRIDTGAAAPGRGQATATKKDGVDQKNIDNPDARQACGGRPCARFFIKDLQGRSRGPATSSGAAITAKPPSKQPSIGSGWSVSTQ